MNYGCVLRGTPLAHVPDMAFKGFHRLAAPALIATLLVSGASPIAAIVPADRALLASKMKNWGLVNLEASSHIHALEAWTLSEGSRKVVVAVIDTGVDVNHPDLASNIWHSEEGVNRQAAHVSKSTASKALGAKSVRSYGWDFVRNSANPRDEHGHGTHVAGIIGAVANIRAGISGVVHQVSIMPVKYYSESSPGSVNLANTVKALHYAIDQGAKVINYSGGGPEFSEAEYNALKKAESRGVLVVAAAGNERQNSDLRENFYYPAAYGLSNIITVAATNIHNRLLPSSNWGAKKVEVAAPGENIYSTLPGGKYGYMSGTSQATAFVTGIAALLLSKDASLTPIELKTLIVSSVDSVPALRGKVSSGGKVNAYRALVALEAKTKNPARIASFSTVPAKLFQ